MSKKNQRQGGNGTGRCGSKDSFTDHQCTQVLAAGDLKFRFKMPDSKIQFNQTLKPQRG